VTIHEFVGGIGKIFHLNNSISEQAKFPCQMRIDVHEKPRFVSREA